jgi:hypothetical protein
MNRIVREDIEIKLRRYNMNREGGFHIRKAWKPLIFSLKKFQDISSGPLGYTVPALLMTLAPY